MTSTLWGKLARFFAAMALVFLGGQMFALMALTTIACREPYFDGFPRDARDWWQSAAFVAVYAFVAIFAWRKLLRDNANTQGQP